MPQQVDLDKTYIRIWQREWASASKARSFQVGCLIAKRWIYDLQMTTMELSEISINQWEDIDYFRQLIT